MIEALIITLIVAVGFLYHEISNVNERIISLTYRNDSTHKAIESRIRNIELQNASNTKENNND